MNESQEQPTDFAPPAILDAALLTLHRALVHVRNRALSPDMNHHEIYDIAEALHEIPNFLSHWSRHDLSELRLHIGYHEREPQPNSLDLLQIFEQRLNELNRNA